MKLKHNKLIAFATSLITYVSLSGGADAALILKIDQFTTDILSITISGTLDADTAGTNPGFIGIKNDYTNSVGVHTELFTTLPTVSSDTVTIGGVTPTRFVEGTATTPLFGDSVYWRAGDGNSPIAAGTIVSGSLTLTGSGIFDPSSVVSLDLVSGGESQSWNRLEDSVTPVPEPSSALLLGLGALGIVARRKRTQ